MPCRVVLCRAAGGPEEQISTTTDIPIRFTRCRRVSEHERPPTVLWPREASGGVASSRRLWWSVAQSCSRRRVGEGVSESEESATPWGCWSPRYSCNGAKKDFVAVAAPMGSGPQMSQASLLRPPEWTGQQRQNKYTCKFTFPCNVAGLSAFSR